MINQFCKTALWQCNKTLIAVAQGYEPAETVIRNAKLVNVNTREIQEGTDVAVACGRIAYVGNASHCIGSSTKIIDAAGAYLSPGFLDGHIHVESSMMGAAQYARAVIAHGTVGIYWDPHEVANVAGLQGVKEMVEDVRRTPLKAMVTTPSCVPAVPGFEDTGSSIDADDVAETMAWDCVVGLGEMMNFPGVLAGADQPLEEIAATLKADGCVTGHYSVPETDRGLNAYISSGVRCCHESTRPEDALAKIRLGMYAQFREGSAWRDLSRLAHAIKETGLDTRLCCLVSDDTHPNTLASVGHIDHILRRAVEEGIDPLVALQMATINTATCFHMDHELGSIAPGKCADLVLFDNLTDFNVSLTMIDGNVAALDGTATFDTSAYDYPAWMTNTVRIGHEITPQSFAIPAVDAHGNALEGDSACVRVIEMASGRVDDRETRRTVPLKNGLLESSPDQDVLKAFVFERHHETGTHGCGFVSGFGITGALNLPQTVAHDAHNLLVVGSNDEDMALAANTLVECGGGAVAVRDGKVLGLVKLPIAGLMSDKPLEEVALEVDGLERAWENMGCTMVSPFMTMALLPLACIPELRLTNRGLVDCLKFEFVPLVVEE